MAMHVKVTHVEMEPGEVREPRVLIVDALGVSGGDRCHELEIGQSVDFWLGDDGRITLFRRPD